MHNMVINNEGSGYFYRVLLQPGDQIERDGVSWSLIITGDTGPILTM